MSLTPLLSHSPVFRSRCAEETQGFLNAKDHRLELGRRPASLDVQLNGVYLPGLYLGYAAYGDAAVTARSGASHTEFWLHLPLAGRIRAQRPECEVVGDGGSGLLIAPSQKPWCLNTEARGARLQLALDRAAMLRRLEALLGDVPTRPIEFAPAVDLTRGHGRTLAGHALLAVADLERPDSALSDPLTLEAFEEFLTTLLLMGQPHSYRAALLRLDRNLAPRDVKRAVEYIREHLHLPIGIADIARAAGVPGRTLFKHFQDFKGVSPMRYVRDARLARARQALRASAGESVTAIALNCGFTHLGRFSAEYRRAFGESPSRTLAASRS